MSEKTPKADITKVTPKDLSRLPRVESRGAEAREKKEQLKPEKVLGPHGSEAKVRAVLSLWSGRRRPAEVCREYGVKYTLLSHWERRALEGMLQALEPRVRLDQGPALSPRLQALLEGKSLKLRLGKVSGKLEDRLSRIQDSKDKKEPKDLEKKT